MFRNEHDVALALCHVWSHQEISRTTFLQKVLALLIPCRLIDGSATSHMKMVS